MSEVPVEDRFFEGVEDIVMFLNLCVDMIATVLEQLNIFFQPVDDPIHLFLVILITPHNLLEVGVLQGLLSTPEGCRACVELMLSLIHI